MQQLSMCKEDIFSGEQQKWNQRVNLESEPTNIKEEQQELWINRGGEHLRQLEEADVNKFPFTVVLVKSEDEEKSLVSEFHESQTEITEAELQASSSTDHSIVKLEVDGEDSRGPQPFNSSGPCSPLQLDPNHTRTDCYETEIDGSYEWKQSRKPHSAFNCLKNSDISVSDTKTNMAKKCFSCPECGKTFGQKNNLNTHMRIHTGDKPFGCFECGERFGQKGNLNTHMRIHTGEKPFGCTECGERFGQKSNLNTHMRIHTGEKPFSCSECGERFGHKSSLSKHLRIHTGQKPFDCSECGKRFGQKSSLNTHMKIHTGEKLFCCSECGKRFRERGTLNKHFRIHTGEKPFSCFECGEKFGHKSSLNTHFRIHTGEKPFDCSECGKRFGHKSSLNKHLRIHTGET